MPIKLRHVEEFQLSRMSHVKDVGLRWLEKKHVLVRGLSSLKVQIKTTPYGLVFRGAEIKRSIGFQECAYQQASQTARGPGRASSCQLWL